MNASDHQLRQALRTYANEISGQIAPPPASLVFLRAERRARRLALDRATRPLRIMQTVALLAAVIAFTVLIQAARPTPHLVEFGAGAMILVLAGIGTLLLAGRRLT